MECCSRCCRRNPAIDGAREAALGGGQKPFYSRRAKLCWACCGASLLLVVGVAIAVLTVWQRGLLSSPTAPTEVRTFEGEFDWAPSATVYLGGFCFRAAYHSEDKNGEHTKVGDVTIKLAGDTPQGASLSKAFAQANAATHMYMLLFDDEDKHWGAVQDHWRTSSCEEKMAKASLAVPLPQWEETVAISQYARAWRWHVVLQDCSPAYHIGAAMKAAVMEESKLVNAPVRFRYTMSAHMALTGWGPEETDPADCPQDLWKTAKHEIGSLFA